MKKIAKVLWCIYDELKYANDLRKCQIDNDGIEPPIQTFTVDPTKPGKPKG